MIILLALLTAPMVADPSFSFVECETTHQHISIQPKDDYYIVHFHTRIQDAKGKTVFARVRCNQNTILHSASTKLQPQTDNDLWSLYFRVPKYADANQQNSAVYQIELGDEDLGKIDPLFVRSSFAFKIIRDQASETVTDRDENGPLMLKVQARRAVIDGGVIRIVSEVRIGKGTSLNLNFGLTDSLNNEAFDGDRSARRINN